ncbi:MAG TPA: nitroreductase family protein [Spirochaetota bacterium]|nr:nitroreductase family protein [Spirochaetota bacterium]
MNLLDIIRSRRSVRIYKEEHVSDTAINEILEAARWAPSGLNNQPWRFIVIKDGSLKKKISELTHYSKIVAGSDFCIAVFYNHPAGYNRDKDLMGLGACIQNMLLYAHGEGIGSVWLGEILKNKKKINTLIEVDDSNELMALVAFGIPGEEGKSERKDMNELLIKTI